MDKNVLFSFSNQICLSNLCSFLCVVFCSGEGSLEILFSPLTGLNDEKIQNECAL